MQMRQAASTRHTLFSTVMVCSFHSWRSYRCAAGRSQHCVLANTSSKREIYGPSIYPLKILNLDGRSSIQFRKKCRCASMRTWSNSASVFLVLISTLASGLQIRAAQCALMRYISLCGSVQNRHLALVSICTDSVMQPLVSGQAMTQLT
jgi:hypothetical protein